MSAKAAATAARQVARLTAGLEPEGKDRLESLLARFGYKPELAKRGGGNLARAIETYKLFHNIRPDAAGPELLAHLEQPRCGHPDRDWLDPDTGAPLDREFVAPARNRDGSVTYTVGWRFRRLPDGNDRLDGDAVVRALASTAAVYAHYFGIRLELVGPAGFDAADRYLVDKALPGSTLAQQYLSPNRMPEGQRFRGEYNSRVAWDLLLLARTDLHECGHYLGLNHHPGRNVMNPTIWDFPHPLDARDPRPWLSAAEMATLKQIGYGPPVASPAPPVPPVPVPVPVPPPTPTPPTTPPIGGYTLAGVLDGTATPVPGTGLYAIAGTFGGTFRPH